MLEDLSLLEDGIEEVNGVWIDGRKDAMINKMRLMSRKTQFIDIGRN